MLRASGRDVEVEYVEAPEGFHAEVATSFALYARLAERVQAALDADRFPLVLAGNCGSALGVQQNSGGTFTIASTIVDNGGATSFTVGGTGGTTGAGSVSLTGLNSYTGATTVSGATLAFNSVADGDAPSAIGASSADPSNLVLENGTLRYTGGTASTAIGI